MSDIDRKIVMVSDKLNLMVENQEKLVKIHSKYRWGPRLSLHSAFL